MLIRVRSLRYVILAIVVVFTSLPSGPMSSAGTVFAGVNANPLPPVLDGDDRWGFNHVTPGLGAAQLARNAGGRWNRWEFRWETIQPAVGQFDWSEADRVVNE